MDRHGPDGHFAAAGTAALRPQPGLLTGAAFANRRIGILGGSFNPAHEGHLHISRMARMRLGLDAVWWLVSPGNPLKDPASLARFEHRVAAARWVARQAGFVTVTGLEAQLGSPYTAHTLDWLRQHYPRARFAWLMGADNLLQVHRWHRWQDIFRAMPVAIFPRPQADLAPSRALAAQRFAAARLPESRAPALLATPTPAWTLLDQPLHTASATALRRSGGLEAVQRLAECLTAAA